MEKVNNIDTNHRLFTLASLISDQILLFSFLLSELYTGCLTQTPPSVWRQYEEMQNLENIIDVNFPFNSKFLGIRDFSNVPVKLNQQKT